MIKKCKACDKKFEQYLITEYVPELNGGDYCKGCRDFLKTKFKEDKTKKKRKVKIRWSYYKLPGFEPAPNGIGFIKKCGGK